MLPLAWVKRDFVRKQAGFALPLLNALVLYADTGGTCFPSHATLARQARMSGRSVARHLKHLREAGLLTWERRGHRATNCYRLNLEPAWLRGDLPRNGKSDLPRNGKL